MKNLRYAKSFVLYTDKCEPKIAVFFLRSELDEFVKKFLLENQMNSDNNINMIYHENMIMFTDYKYSDDETCMTSEESKDCFIDKVKKHNMETL